LTDSDTSRFAQIVATDGNLRFDADNNDDQSSTNISFRTDGTERARIDSSGNVGIGISSPSEKLEVAGNIKVGSGGIVNSDTFNNRANSANIIYRSSSTTIVGNNPNALVVADTGNVGIGVTSPDSTLHIKTSVDNSVAQGLVIERSANTDKGYINYNGGAFQIRSTVGDPIAFGETDAEHMRLWWFIRCLFRC
jgi:hypothetical protein